MAKILTDKEIGDIIHKAINDPGELDDADQYQHFLEGLGDLICEHFGGGWGLPGMTVVTVLAGRLVFM